MTLIDTGPIVANLNRRDPEHARCAAAMQRLSLPLVTTWPCLTEALHFCSVLDRKRADRWNVQGALLEMVESGAIGIHITAKDEIGSIHEMMRKYTQSGTSMDFADASMVSAADLLDVETVFTLDSHFYAYRTASGSAFTVVP